MRVESPREKIREGQFDVVIAAAPRVNVWPSIGVRVLSSTCADLGLTVGVFGGDSLKVRGVIPLPGVGAHVVIEDVQRRIHRIHARSLVRVSADTHLPDPFSGWRSDGLLPISTAKDLYRRDSRSFWEPMTVILGTGNEALRFGSFLLEQGVSAVCCVEGFAQWGAKRFAGWEVERRRFEILGGKLIEAVPVSLTPKAPMRWELRIRDHRGIRVLEVGRVVSAGPFRDFSGIREYPQGSLLFELLQSARSERNDEVEGWILEENHALWLGARIARTLLGTGGKVDAGANVPAKQQRRARARIRSDLQHREHPFTPAYDGKWLSSSDTRQIREFGGVPQEAHKKRLVASVECLEPISCDVCRVLCPERAIGPNRVLHEDKCTACGICLQVCPSRIPVLLHLRDEESLSTLVLPWAGSEKWEAGAMATLVNRKGDSLGSARVREIRTEAEGTQLVELGIPTHLVWEARGIRRLRAQKDVEDPYSEITLREGETRVEISLNGDKRLVRDGISVSTALFETGYSRAEDVLHCHDGSCGLCGVQVDGVKKLACQTKVHRGMSVQLPRTQRIADKAADSPALCGCLGITSSAILERMRQGNLRSAEAVLAVTHVGEGKCHGQLCMEPFKRLLADQGLDVTQWIDWRFPWSEWVLGRN